jgi:hypothetical protein
VERDVGLVADNPAVVAEWDVEEVAGLDQSLGAVVHLCDRLSAEDETDVLDLAGGSAGDRRDVLGQAPAWFVRRPAEGRRSDAVDVESSLLEVAVQIAAAAEVYAQEEGIVNVYSDETPGREFVDWARAALSADAVARATEVGRRLTIKEALDLARVPETASV